MTIASVLTSIKLECPELLQNQFIVYIIRKNWSHKIRTMHISMKWFVKSSNPFSFFYKRDNTCTLWTKLPCLKNEIKSHILVSFSTNLLLSEHSTAFMISIPIFWAYSISFVIDFGLKLLVSKIFLFNLISFVLFSCWEHIPVGEKTMKYGKNIIPLDHYYYWEVCRCSLFHRLVCSQAENQSCSFVNQESGCVHSLRCGSWNCWGSAVFTKVRPFYYILWDLCNFTKLLVKGLNLEKDWVPAQLCIYPSISMVRSSVAFIADWSVPSGFTSWHWYAGVCIGWQAGVCKGW